MPTRPKLGLFLGLLCSLVAFFGSQTARAQTASDAPRGIAASGLCGLAQADLPTCPGYLLGVAGSAGYGYTETVGPVEGAHHRVAGTLGVGVTPLSWLSVALRLDGRLDIHPRDSEGSDGTMVGDPRLSVRGGYELAHDVSIGGALGLWSPGAEAPSFKLSALSVDLKVLAAWKPQAKPWSVVANAGFRLDNSAESAPDLRRVRTGDRLSLGLSDSNAVLAALGVVYRIGAIAEAFLELSADLLVGSKAPDLLESPLRATLGGRYFLSRTLQLELAVTGSASARPKLDPTTPLVPIEPRVLTMVGVRYGLPSRSVEQPVNPDPTDVPAQPEPTLAPKVASVAGVLIDAEGAPVSEVTVRLKVGESERETITDAEGRYSFAEVPLGPANLEASAAGFATQTWEVDVVANLPTQSPRTLTATADTGGTLRCLTRTFGSDPLKTQIVIRTKSGREVKRGETNAQGMFEIQLTPGAYEVIITAPGYRTHRGSVKVSSNGVAILNVDMREK